MKKEWTEQDLRAFAENAQTAFEDVTLTEADEEAADTWQDDGLQVDYVLRNGQVDCVLRGIDEKLSMHDFRVVDGERQINLIFDVVVPFSYDDEGKRRLLMTIYDDLKAIDQRFNPVVTLDHAM